MAVEPVSHTEPVRRPTGTTVKYNPHLWTDDELRDIFVVRQAQLDELLDRMRSTPADAAPQATLFVGARGMGKTTLLRRLALAVREDAELARDWLPLSFPEEQYTVSGLGELWRNVLDALIDALERSAASRAEIAELDRQAHDLAATAPEAQAGLALALINHWCQLHQRRLVLLIDSTDLLLEGLKKSTRAPAKKLTKAASAPASHASHAAPAVDDSALWQLRQTLLDSKHLMWVGASYQSLESHHAYDQAFHDFFDLIDLRPLSLDDMRDALVALAGRFGMRGAETPAQAMLAMQNALAARPERLLALRAITGGNPRTTAILYDLFAAGADGDLHSDLRGLLDLMTPLYKARMEQLPEQPRKVLAHVMEAWDPIALRDLAQAAGIASSTVSSQLVRLEQDGLVHKAALSGTRRSGYQVAERFFNIWFLMRHASRRVRQRLTWLVEFMRLWYRAEELEGAIGERIEPGNPYAWDQQGRLLVGSGRYDEASALYRRSVDAMAGQGLEVSENGSPLLLQAHLWLGNSDLALQHLDRLVKTASAGPSTGSKAAFAMIRVQVFECHQMGIGIRLAELMARSELADFLLPYQLALHAAAGSDGPMMNAAAEIQVMARAVLLDLVPAQKSQG